jgi:putative flavoprotein involved in K+ transport
VTVAGREPLRPAGTVDVLVIGAGHAGLATSYCLSERSIDHVVLERGEVANSWRNERWDSLTLLTPNWQSRLPGFSYSGDDPDGFMSMPEVIRFISDYAEFSSAPVYNNTAVTSVRLDGDEYCVTSDAGEWRCRSVVIASGACNVPVKPAVADDVPDMIKSLTPHEYRGPEQIEPGGVLVVGASATGMQLADEIQRAGHDITIAVGEHVRMPRTYRGRDIQFWLHAAGILNERYDEVDDIVRARRLPSPQLVGAHSPALLDLNSLTDNGAKLVGRMMGVRDGVAQFSGSLRNVCALADLKMHRMLEAMDEWAEENSDAGQFDPVERFERTRVDDTADLTLSLNNGEIATIVWATGFRPDYSWLDVPVLDRKGRIRHDGGVADIPGLYVVGLPVLRRRKSSFIHGTEDDARDLTAHLADYLDSKIHGYAARHGKIDSP